ncbi:YdgA family protein [Legionella pneumophila]|uniref:Virulence protein n=1 Tax=Legionella pneumophila subsp. pascullei TaxID=91890 RepID=A0AAX2IXW1_LEGPN|nr:YdgA family protein [Legionella pneumophila]AMP89032.1 virulence factor [Legionella pneumophila subsp. pascullei]AMP93300.1 virulence factor [Legionella pneumophila subsp. pascullei]AMP96266.1 virulence factor [Legionella pneumophila subsp. pascullei]SQG91227.1 putative virulence protein [Legionella pneumophila subsp. pascullei]VEH07773.1 putative virulence protein [Legionella pneumophila subsp. pascullei]
MKKWIISLLLLIVIVLCSYPIIGMMALSTVKKNVDNIPRNPFLTWQLKDNHRGWFCSTGVLNLLVNLPAQENKDAQGNVKVQPALHLSLDFPMVIHHGPVIMTNNGLRFGLAWVTTKPETHYGALINYLNQTIVSYSLPSINMQGTNNGDQGNFVFVWQGLSAKLKVNPRIDKASGHVTMHGMSTKVQETDVRIGKVKVNFALNRYMDDLWLGDSSILLSSVSTITNSQPVFDLQNLSVDAWAGVNNNLLDFNLQLSLKKFLMNNNSYGPGQLKIKVKNLDPQAMAKLNQLNYDYPSNQIAILAEIFNLLSKGATLNLNQELDTPQGHLSSSLNLVLARSSFSTPEDLLQNLKGNGQFKAPMKLVKQLLFESIKSKATTPPADMSQSQATEPDSAQPVDADAHKQTEELLQKLVSKGILKVEGDYYHASFTLENTKFTVNGQPFDPALLN